jgi:hypothetical protein
VVLVADAVVDPLAVVVESVNAAVAGVAVARLLRLQDFTGRAKEAWLEELVELYERNLL